LALGRGGPRDLGALRDGLACAQTVREVLRQAALPLERGPKEHAESLAALEAFEAGPGADLARDLKAFLVAEPPPSAKDGGFIAGGAIQAVDAARQLRDDSRQVVAALELELQQQSGVALRVRHNAVLGFFVEASAKASEPLRRPPLDGVFLHRQTLANQARFTTAELIELGSRVLEAGERALELELAAFEGLRTRCLDLSQALRRAAAALTTLDVAAAFAHWAEEVGAVRPEVNEGLGFEAFGARHPVVEAAVVGRGDPYTANDCRLDGSGAAGPRLCLVTGPNMAGKSTFLRQNALLVVLAQAGSFVPAKSLRLGVVDRLFSRVGAGDDLARGRSTFMMEMVETAAILTQATDRSFVVLDEIGRGTATYDGLALAWACAEALHDANRCRALFATHYHELAQLEGRLGHVRNLSMRAREWNGDLVFLHQAVAGAADRSYGVQVARLAGVPQAVVRRALEVLGRLESEPGSPSRLDDLPLFAAAALKTPPARSPLQTAVDALDPDALSPREALEALYRLKACAAGPV
jgi:DNA mismatch repair protein MutS